MMAKVQRFGGAMFTPVLFFVFSGIVVALATVLNNPDIVGSIAKEGTMWNNIWQIIESGGWTVFNNMEILFAIGLPLGLANKAKSRAALESFVLYMTFNVFVSKILELFGTEFNVEFSQEVGSGLKLIGGVKTLDTGVLGAIIVASIVIYLHNKYFDTKLPEFLGVFQGSSLVAMIGFWVMLVLAFVFSWIWPMFQIGVQSLQGFMVKSGNFGVFTYIFLEKALLPTGLHHFIYAPFQYGPAVVEGGTTLYWMEHMKEFANSSQSLKTLFPEGGFSLQGLSNLFGIPGIALAFYSTAKKENKKKVLALLVPGVLTAVLCGITEPFDYTFLFVAPVLFLVHAVLAAILATTQYAFGVVGDMGGGLIELITKNWIPMWSNHWSTYLIQLLIGVLFIAIYFVIFKLMIEKFDFKTPGRDESSIELYTKKDFKEKNESSTSQYTEQARGFLEAFGGKANIESVANCATRLRVSVYDETKVLDNEFFKKYGAHGVVRKNNAFQVIVGMSVPQVRESFEDLINKD
ncbi:alpha-glucoside-specific PTS transporter subunit IIBC [Vagococcus lutrae]|uniref:alpha-glucoside-specific PTS transporter subunit IIBC n=1 Tax=Vagococcus lutrae TaxID=81947 RepID=UPI00200C9AF3|nr:alpha-glucoside-specific PTS transporter subunit IIBC [Vagococcus lutrae]MDT2824167.1 alpha-glucoside-specific PTS transporter subunit IIBC [Vagococcus lutrae]UQF18310.1 alpha-glucoside-specific PTS transporter subunit IIBC [Vagococcus lutrae]